MLTYKIYVCNAFYCFCCLYVATLYLLAFQFAPLTSSTSSTLLFPMCTFLPFARFCALPQWVSVLMSARSCPNFQMKLQYVRLGRVVGSADRLAAGRWMGATYSPHLILFAFMYTYVYYIHMYILVCLYAFGITAMQFCIGQRQKKWRHCLQLHISRYGAVWVNIHTIYIYIHTCIMMLVVYIM